jgi:hypothetical protein
MAKLRWLCWPSSVKRRPRASSSSPEGAQEATAEQDEPQDGLKSPEVRPFNTSDGRGRVARHFLTAGTSRSLPLSQSERLADDLLREPFQAGAHLQLQVGRCRVTGRLFHSADFLHAAPMHAAPIAQCLALHSQPRARARSRPAALRPNSTVQLLP